MKSDDYGWTDRVHHCIDKGDAQTICQFQTRLSLARQAEVGKMVHNGNDKGLLKSQTASSHPPVIQIRKKNGCLHFCVDYRRLGNVTRKVISQILEWAVRNLKFYCQTICIVPGFCSDHRYTRNMFFLSGISF